MDPWYGVNLSSQSDGGGAFEGGTNTCECFSKPSLWPSDVSHKVWAGWRLALVVSFPYVLIVLVAPVFAESKGAVVMLVRLGAVLLEVRMPAFKGSGK